MALYITSLKQVPPITTGMATLSLSFQITGSPSFVQVYCAVPGPSLGNIVALVPIKSGQADYSNITFKVPAGAYLYIYVCPREGPENLPSNTTDGVNWADVCAVSYIVTKTVAPTVQELDPPVIAAFVPLPADKNRPNRVTVVWSSQTSYDKYVLGWLQDGTVSDPTKVDLSKLTVNMDDPAVTTKGSIDLKISGTSGSYDFPTSPRTIYFFRVNGGISQFWNYRYSSWGPTQPCVSGGNSTSLRTFLSNSGLDPAAQGVRSLLSPGQTVRQFMKI